MMYKAICDSHNFWHIILTKDEKNTKILMSMTDKTQALKIRDQLNKNTIQDYENIRARRDNMSSPGDKNYEI